MDNATFVIQEREPNFGNITTKTTTVKIPHKTVSLAIDTKTPLDCIQEPFRPTKVNQSLNDLSKKYAYVWYATSNPYFCSAIVALKYLKKLRNGTNLKVDYVLTYSKADSLNTNLMNQWKANGGILRNFDGLGQYLNNGYYKKCLQKFRAMLLFEYQRVIIMDSDGIANHNLDPLFHIPFPQGIKIAAPQGWWFENQGYDIGHNGQQIAIITSILLVIEPDQNLFNQMASYFGKRRPQSNREFFDMDIINHELSKNGKILVLPKFYGALNSEFELDKSGKAKSKPCKNFDLAQYIHWTAIGKPWSFTTSKYVKKHEEVIQPLIKTWFRLAFETCPRIVQNHA